MLLIAYDIPSDLHRRRLAKVLEKWGRRVQYSVFECEVPVSKRSKLDLELRRELCLEEDSVRIYDFSGLSSMTLIGLGLGPGQGAPASVVF